MKAGQTIWFCSYVYGCSLAKGVIESVHNGIASLTDTAILFDVDTGKSLNGQWYITSVNNKKRVIKKR